MSNIPGTTGFLQPDSFSRVRTIRRALSIPGGLRILCCMGLGESEETLVLSALGGGQDGVNPNYAAANAPDGRHFEISKTNLIARRTTVFLNSIPLSGLEEQIDTNAFDSRYDYRLEALTGRIELQRAHLRDQGGLFAVPGTSNVGTGFDVGVDGSTLSLLDVNAPAETWTLRVTSVIRDGYGNPISGQAVFNVTGSVSGVVNDAYGAPIVFVSDGVVRDNGILNVKIEEGATAFDRGDRFTIIVDSKVLSQGDTLIVRMIATQDLNDPTFFTDPNSLFAKHGEPSEANTLSLGANLAFENGAFGVLALQAKPALPRRTSEVMQEADDLLSVTVEGFPPLAVPPTPSVTDIDQFKFTIDGGVPDADTAINIFVINGTDGVETQIFPTKFAFFSPVIGDGDASQYADFIDNAGHSFEYTVILESEVEDEGNDGVAVSSESTFTSPTAAFREINLDAGETDVGKIIRIQPFDRFGNSVSAVAGTYEITAVGDGTGDNTVVTLTAGGTDPGTIPFTASATDLRWELLDTADTSAKLLLTSDLLTSGTYGTGDGLRISYIDTNDADFYDNNWAAAYDVLETANCQMVVPLPDQAFSAIQQAGRVHCELMSTTANKRERVLLIGAQAGVTSDALIGRELVAVEDIGVLEGIQGDDPEEVLGGNIEDLQNFDVSVNYGTSFRVIYFYPDEIVRVVQGTRTTIHGFYLAAAAAGRLAGTANVAIPLTRKVLIGFSILRDKLLKTQTQNELGGNGVTVVQPVTGGGVILHGKTTTASGAPEEEEISIVFIRDTIAQGMRNVMRAFIGQPEDATLASSIASAALAALTAYQGQGLITDFRSLNVTRDEIDPRQWDIIFEVMPNYPVNWIFIDLSVGLL